MAQTKAAARAALKLKTLQAQLAVALEERDGFAMRSNSYEAKINGQERHIELLKKQGQVAQARAEAYKQISSELIEQLKDAFTPTEVHHEEPAQAELPGV